MTDFQEQLRQYRLQKRRQQTIDTFKSKLRRFWMLGTGKDSAKEKSDTTYVEIQNENTSTTDSFEESEQLISSEDEVLSTEQTPEFVDPAPESNCMKYTRWTVYFLFWVTLYIIAIELKFGLVFLMFSALFGIYFNTRTTPKQRNEISAYSVFNKDCHSIDGTLKAEQFEREIRYGSGSVR